MEYIGNIIYDDKLLDKDRKFVIYGSGIYGRKILQYMNMNGMKDHIISFCNSTDTYIDQVIQNIPIVCVKAIAEQYPDADYLVSGKYVREMYQTLKENSIKRIHILFI